MAGENIVNLTNNNFKSEVLEYKGTVLVDFWAVWCGPCKMVAPLVESLADEYQGKVKVCKLNVDENNGIAVQYGIMSIPTLMIFKNGEEVNRLIGFMPKEKIAQAVDSIL